ncbi:BAG family molecular chaperone regulator 1 [Choloepus didactylus]|uniref:BAG family molecular chaperone regulator 1 n=1 Tax=Choloepus didactylus TaxID=27675 RepID=UPI00189D912D|nr:BAG family molecular chaperone regulator 1 [Choloepus didactylus]
MPVGYPFFRVFSSAFPGTTLLSAPAPGRSRSAGLAERGGARKPRGQGDRRVPRRLALRSGREPRQPVLPAEPGQLPSQRPPSRSGASGHDRSTRSTAAGACRPRVKKKVRPRATRSEEMARSEDNAAAGVNVTVTHSNEKHDLHVTPQQGCSEPVVQDLAQVVEETTGVPLPFQKLIFKGKSLKEMEQPLSALGIQNGCRVMLIGKKNSPEEEAELKKLKDLEESVEKIANQLEGLNKELTGIQQGFLAKDLQAEALAKLDRRVKATIEQFMKILEEIDTLVLPENFKDSRLKRKGLVQKVQAFLAECDTVEQSICQETEQLQSTNLALAE